MIALSLAIDEYTVFNLWLVGVFHGGKINSVIVANELGDVPTIGPYVIGPDITACHLSNSSCH